MLRNETYSLDRIGLKDKSIFEAQSRSKKKSVDAE